MEDEPMTFRAWLFVLFSILISTAANADTDYSSLLNKITLQLKAEQWVTTKTALVTASVNAAVTDQGIEKMQAKVVQKLARIADKSEWHITDYTRSQDKTGLERIQMTAQARLPQDSLANIRTNAKSISTPGETYDIEDVQFTPSEDEMRLVNLNLRNNLYLQAKSEIDALNKVYPDQKFYIHQIDFISPIIPEPVPMNYMAKAAKPTMAMAQVQSVSPLTIDNKLTVQATVIVASMTSPNTQVTKLN